MPAAARKDMFVESAGRRDSVSLTPLQEVDISCVGTPSVDDRTFRPRISCLDLSIASIVARALVTATHSGDPKDPGVASRTVNRAARRPVGPRGACAWSITGPE